MDSFTTIPAATPLVYVSCISEEAQGQVDFENGNNHGINGSCVVA